MGDGNKVEFLVAICALLTSVMAVYMAWDQGRVMRAQQHGAVFPVLQISGSVATTDVDRSMGIVVSNNGVGPALIESVSLTKNGKPVSDLRDELPDLPGGWNISWAGLPGRAVAPGESVEPVRIRWSKETLDAQTFSAAVTEWADLSLRVCYCSVFRRCWQSTGLGNARAEEVSTCPADQNDPFEDLGFPLTATNTETAPTKEPVQ